MIKVLQGIRVKSAFESITDEDVVIPAATGLAVGAPLAHSYAKGLYNAPLTHRPVITIGGGRITRPSGDTGAGHVTHARGMIEGLQAHPDVKGGDVIAQLVMPNTWEIENLPEHMHSDVTVTSGYAGIPEDRFDPHFKKTPDFVPKVPEHASRYERLKGLTSGRVIQFTPDMPFELNSDFSAPKTWWQKFKNMLTNFGLTRHHYRGSILYGNRAVSPSPFAHFRTAPTIPESALSGIRDVHEHPDTTAAEVYEDYAKSLEKENPEAAKYIRQGIAEAAAEGRPYKPFLVTGSSRGDYVAKKTLDLLDVLHGTPEAKEYHVIPILGANKDITGQLLEGTGIPRFAGIPPKLYNKLRGYAAAVAGSSGPGEWAEAKALPAPLFVPIGHEDLRDAEIAMLGGKIDEAARSKLKAVETEKWNLGGFQDVVREKPHGIHIYRNPGDILIKLRDPDFMSKAKNLARSQQYLGLAVGEKADLAQKLVNEAYHQTRMSNIRGNWGKLGLVGGAGILGGGALGYGGLKAYRHFYPKEKTSCYPSGILVKAAKKNIREKLEDLKDDYIEEVSPVVTGVGTAGLAGTGAMGLDYLHRAITHKPHDKPSILIAGGRVAVPGIDVGAGHMNPAKAYYEALLADPDVRSGRVRVEGMFPTNYQLDEPVKNLRPDLAVTLGYSGAPGDYYDMRGKLLEHMVPEGAWLPETHPSITKLAPVRQRQFFTDPQRTVGLGNIVEKIRTGFNFLPFAPAMIQAHMDPSAIRFGDPGNWVPSHLKYPKANPLITESAMAPIEELLQTRPDVTQVYENWASELAKDNPEAAEYIRKGIAEARAAGRPFRPVPITGSSRGDYVAQRALDLLEALKQHPRGHEILPVPILAGNVGVTGRLLEGTGLPRIGRVPAKFYSQIRGTGAGLLSGTGASEIAEAKMFPVNIQVPEDQKALRLREIMSMRRHPKGLTDVEGTALRHAMTDLFNEGELQQAKRRPLAGITVSDNLRAFIDRVLSTSEVDAGKNLARAKQYLTDTRMAKADLAHQTVLEAIESAKKGRMLLHQKHPYLLAGGALAAGLGGYKAHKYLRDKERRNA